MGPDLQAQLTPRIFFWCQFAFGSPLAGLESEDWSPCLWNGDRPCCVTIDPAEGGGTCFGTGTMVNNGDMLEIPQFVGRFFCDLSYLLSCNSMAKARWFRPNKLYRTLFFSSNNLSLKVSKDTNWTLWAIGNLQDLSHSPAPSNNALKKWTSAVFSLQVDSFKLMPSLTESEDWVRFQVSWATKATQCHAES